MACDTRPEPLDMPPPTRAPEIGDRTPTAGVAERHPPVQAGVLSAPINVDAQLLVAVYSNVNSSQPPSTLERVRINQQGIVERVTSLDPGKFVPGAYINSWRNVHEPAGGSGGEVIVALCHGGCGGIGPADAAAKTTLVRTRDNGVTWETLATLDGAYWVVSWRANLTEVVLFDFPTATDQPAQRPSRFVRWPSMQPINPPTATSGTAPEQHWPVPLVDGRVGWWTGGRMLDETGKTILDLATVGSSTARPIAALPSPSGERLVVTWGEGTPPSQKDTPSSQRWYWTLFERVPNGSYEARRTISQFAVRSDGLFLAVPYLWLSDDRVMIPAGVPGIALGLPADTRVGYVPAVLDFPSGEVRPLAAFADPAVVGRGNLVIGVAELK